MIGAKIELSYTVSGIFLGLSDKKAMWYILQQLWYEAQKLPYDRLSWEWSVVEIPRGIKILVRNR